jgi:hypothetical protein
VTGNTVLDGNLTVTGTDTFNGISTFNQPAHFASTAYFQGGIFYPQVLTSGLGASLTYTQSGSLLVSDVTLDTECLYTLPAANAAANNQVIVFKFVFNSAALGNNRDIKIATASGDNIVGVATSAGSSGLLSTAGPSHGIILAHNVAVRGNFVVLESNGANTWFMTSVSGTWAIW